MFKSNMHASHLSRYDAWVAIHRTIMKSLLYPLPALTLTEAEFCHIMVPFLLSSLPAAGINGRIDQAVLYGPKSLQGLGVIIPYVF